MTRVPGGRVDIVRIPASSLTADHTLDLARFLPPPSLRVKTEMTARYDQSGCISPEASAEGIAARVDELSLTNTGTFWHQNGQILPW